jgi:hypothetical protein
MYIQWSARSGVIKQRDSTRSFRLFGQLAIRVEANRQEKGYNSAPFVHCDQRCEQQQGLHAGI